MSLACGFFDVARSGPHQGSAILEFAIVYFVRRCSALSPSLIFQIALQRFTSHRSASSKILRSRSHARTTGHLIHNGRPLRTGSRAQDRARPLPCLVFHCWHTGLAVATWSHEHRRRVVWLHGIHVQRTEFQAPGCFRGCRRKLH